MSELLRIEAAVLSDAWCEWNGHAHRLSPHDPFECASAAEFINDLGPLIAGLIDARVEASVEMADQTPQPAAPVGGENAAPHEGGSNPPSGGLWSPPSNPYTKEEGVDAALRAAWNAGYSSAARDSAGGRLGLNAPANPYGSSAELKITLADQPYARLCANPDCGRSRGHEGVCD